MAEDIKSESKQLTSFLPEEIQKKNYVHFFQSILDQESRAKSLKYQEHLLTSENPRTREAKEITDISAEIRELKRKQYLEEKRRQRLNQDNEELRMLQHQLRCAEMSKTVTEQRAALQRNKEEKQQQWLQERAESEAVRKRQEMEELKLELEERKKKIELREILQRQMAEKEEQRRQAQKEVLLDRQDMQAFLRRIKDDEVLERQAYERRKQMSQQEIEEFLRSREILKQQRRTERIEESERILEVLHDRDAKKRRRDEEKRLRREKREAAADRMIKSLAEIQKEQTQREDFLLDLLVEERVNREAYRYRQDCIKHQKDRMLAHRELDSYAKSSRYHKKQEELREEQQTIMEQEKINEKIDQQLKLEEEQNRQKAEKHKEAVLALIDDQRCERILAAAEELRDHEIRMDEMKKKKEEIAEERYRQLSAAPTDLLRYMPTGALTETERKLLSQSNGNTNSKLKLND